jgi:hypothetical protein
MKNLLAPILSSLITGGVLLSATAQASTMLSPLTTFGNAFDGTIQPGASDPYPPLDTGNNQRGMACDPVSGNVVLVDTHTGGGGGSLSGAIYIVDGIYGTNITTLNTNGMVYAGGGYADAAAGVADDGVVYVADQVNNSATTAFIIYRWDSVTSTAPPLMCFSNTIIPGQRYGISFDIRGAGADTQIIIGSQSQTGSSGTNVVIFTTADGTNFSANVLSTGVSSPNFNDGIAFGLGNTFWAKRVGAPLRLMTFNLATLSATTVQSFDSSVFVGSANLGPIAVDNVNHLLAAIDVVTGATGPEHVRLYDISVTNAPPVLLDLKDYVPNNVNATAPAGYLDFGGGRLYSHVINNGMATFSVGTVSTPLPLLLTQLPATNRVPVGTTVRYEMLAYPQATYQWKKNGTNVSGATNAYYVITAVTTNDVGQYHVLVSNGGGSVDSTTNQLIVLGATDLYHLNLVWSAAPGSAPYIDNTGGGTTPNQRTIAYNALSNELYIVSRANSSGQNFVIYAVNGTNISSSAPAVVKTLNTNGLILGPGGISVVGMAVADDGAIYACNMIADATGGGGTAFRVYRWADSDTNTLPVQIFTGEPASQSSAFRWGDNLTVRGAGLGTQILLDNYDNSQRYISILTPTDATMLNWSATYNFESQVGAGIGRSLEWGSGNTIWQKRRATALVQSSVDPSTAGGIASTLASYASLPGATPTVIGAVGLDLSRNLLVGLATNSLSVGPASLNLYDVTSLNAPIALAAYTFPQSPYKLNTHCIGQCFFAGEYVFAILGNNGVMAYKVVSGPPTPPAFLVQPRNLPLVEGSSGTLSVTLDQTAAYQWQKGGTNISSATTSSYTINPAQLSDAANYRCIASNLFGMNTSSVAVVTVRALVDVYHFSPLWSVGPQSRPYLPPDTDTSKGQTPLYRSIAYNSLSNQIYIISRTSASSGLTINVLDGSTGADLYQLDTTGITDGSIVLLGMGVGTDGSLYAANEDVSSGSSPAVYKLYRWADSASTTVPSLVYSGEPANQGSAVRWGDNMDVRGGGIDTEVLVDAYQGTFAAILKPVDSSLSSFTSSYFTENTPSTPIGRSLQFGPTNTVWQKRSGKDLLLYGYNLGTQTGTLLSTYTGFPTTLGPVALDLSRSILTGINIAGVSGTTPDTVSVYDISDLSAPLLIATYNFPSNSMPNKNMVGQIIFAGNRVFALDGNNGIAAFEIIAPARPRLDAALDVGKIVLSWANSFSGYTLYSSSVATGPYTTSEGTGTVVGNYYQVTNTVSGTQKYYRLEK